MTGTIVLDFHLIIYKIYYFDNCIQDISIMNKVPLEYTNLDKAIHKISKQYKKKYKDLRGFPRGNPPFKKSTT